jgi:DNA-binding transcriptional LysR family regulator
LDIKQLMAVIAVAEEGSVTSAARRLRLVQPAVSRQLQALETELGVELFERTRSGMHLTAAGEVMLERARRALGELDLARAELQLTPHDVRGVVSVGLLDSMTDLLAEPLVTAIADAYPQIHLRLLTAYSGHLREWLNAGDLDLALLYDLRPSGPFRIEPAGREQLWAVAPPTAQLSVERPTPMKDLLDVPLILPEAGHGLRVLIDRAFATIDRAPHVAVETNSMRIQKSLVGRGHGWTILPAVGIAPEIAAGTFSGAPLCDPWVHRTVAVVSREIDRRSNAIRAVAGQLGECIERAKAREAWPISIEGSND